MSDELETCDLDDATAEHFQTSIIKLASYNACRVRAGNSCGSGAFVGLYQNGALILSNAHVTSSRVGSQSTFQFDPTVSSEIQRGRIIMAAYSTRITADWSISLIPGWTPRIKPLYCTRQRPTSQDRFYTSGAPKCVFPLRHQHDLKLLSNNNAGFAVWDKPAVGGQSGSSVINDKTDLAQLLLTWRTGNNNGAGQPLDFIWSQGKTALETGALIGGQLPIDAVPLSNINTDCEEGFFAEMSIRSLPIWFEDLKPIEPQPEPPIDPDQPCDLPISRAELTEYLRSIKDTTETFLNRIERVTDDLPNTPPPSNGNTFGL